MFVRFLSSEQENRDKENGGRVGERDAVKFRKTPARQREKPQTGRTSVRMGGWEVKKMTQLSSERGGQDR